MVQKTKVYSIRIKISLGLKPKSIVTPQWKLGEKTKVYSIRMKIRVD